MGAALRWPSTQRGRALNVLHSENTLQCDRVHLDRSWRKESRVHRALVDQAKRGDREAFDMLARTVGDRCMAIAYRILRDADRADDAVQAALIRAWCDLRSLRDSDRFEPWLHRILTNECYAEARRRNRWSSAQVRLLPMPDQRDSAEISAINDRDQLDRAFRRLTARAALGAGVPSLRRSAPSGRRRAHGNSRRDRDVPTSSRHPGAPGQPRR